MAWFYNLFCYKLFKMKREIKQLVKPVIAVLLLSTIMSSCVVRETEHRRPPPPTEKVIIRP